MEKFNLTTFNLQNPWRNGLGVKKFVWVEREIFKEVEKWVEEEEIIVITGARQVGKTTMLRALINFLITKKDVSPRNIFYFNLDSLSLLEFFEDPAELVKFIKSQAENNKKIYVFIDEFQRITEAGLFLKFIYDLGTDIKFIISGSSSLQIGKTVKETLTGRKQVFQLEKFSFKEFLKFKGKENFLETDSVKYALGEMEDLFEEYLKWGGYPKVILQDDQEKKKQILNELYESYIKKDIADFLRVDNIVKFNKLVKILASQTGNLLNINEIARTISLERQELEKYVSILEQTFIITLLRPYFTNTRKELVKMPKVYINDFGLYNILSNNFNSIDTRSDKGQLAETFVFHILKKKNSLKYWRTQTGAELDFLWDAGAGILEGAEVKFSYLDKPIMTRSVASFKEKYTPRRLYILNRNFWEEDAAGKGLSYMPLWAADKI